MFIEKSCGQFNFLSPAIYPNDFGSSKLLKERKGKVNWKEILQKQTSVEEINMNELIKCAIFFLL